MADYGARQQIPSFQGLVAQIGLSLGVSVICLGIFEWNRRKKTLEYLYSPRTRLKVNPTPPMSLRFLGWIRPTLQIPESFYLDHVGLDAVMFLRFLKMCLQFCFFNAVVAGTILMPIHYFANTETPIEVARLSISNVPNDSNLLWAHVFLAYVVSISWMLLVFKNYWQWMDLRREYTLERIQQGEIAERSIFISRLPVSLRSDGALKQYFESLKMGPVESATVVPHCGRLSQKLDRRESALNSLERAHIDMARVVIESAYKATKKTQKEDRMISGKVKGASRSSGGWFGFGGSKSAKKGFSLPFYGNSSPKTDGADTQLDQLERNSTGQGLGSGAAGCDDHGGEDGEDVGGNSDPRHGTNTTDQTWLNSPDTATSLHDHPTSSEFTSPNIFWSMIQDLILDKKRHNKTRKSIRAATREKEQALSLAMTFSNVHHASVPISTLSSCDSNVIDIYVQNDGQSRSVAQQGGSMIASGTRSALQSNHQLVVSDKQEQNKDDTATGTGNDTSSMPSIWSVLASMDRKSLDSFQPMRLPHAFRKGDRIESIDYFVRKYNRLDRRVGELRDGSLRFKSTSFGFVTFKNHISAQLCAQNKVDSRPQGLSVRLAMEPRDVLWSNLSASFRNRFSRQIFVNLSVWVLIVFWIFPTSSFLLLTSISALSEKFTFLQPILAASPLVMSLLQNVLPIVFVTIFLAIAPVIILEISKQELPVSHSALEQSVFRRYYHFLIFNVLFVFMIGTAILKSIIALLQTPTNIFTLLANSLPLGSTFFIFYIVFQTCTHGLELAQIWAQLVLHGFVTAKKLTPTPRNLQRAITPWAFQYYYYYPHNILALVITFIYSVISPLILWAAVVYFAIAVVVFKYQFAYCYVRRYENCGRLFRLVFHYSTDGLIIFQITMVGVLWLKEAIVGGFFVLALLGFTIYFKVMCSKLFSSRTKYLPLDTGLRNFAPRKMATNTGMDGDDVGNGSRMDEDGSGFDVTGDKSGADLMGYHNTIPHSLSSHFHLHQHHHHHHHHNHNQQQQQSQSQSHQPIPIFKIDDESDGVVVGRSSAVAGNNGAGFSQFSGISNRFHNPSQEPITTTTTTTTATTSVPLTSSKSETLGLGLGREMLPRRYSNQSDRYTKMESPLRTAITRSEEGSSEEEEGSMNATSKDNHNNHSTTTNNNINSNLNNGGTGAGGENGENVDYHPYRQFYASGPSDETAANVSNNNGGHTGNRYRDSVGGVSNGSEQQLIRASSSSEEIGGENHHQEVVVGRERRDTTTSAMASSGLGSSYFHIAGAAHLQHQSSNNGYTDEPEGVDDDEDEDDDDDDEDDDDDDDDEQDEEEEEQMDEKYMMQQHHDDQLSIQNQQAGQQQQLQPQSTTTGGNNNMPLRFLRPLAEPHFRHIPSRVQYQDQTSDFESYTHPALLKTLNRKMWLPLNPLYEHWDLDRTVEIEFALISSGQIGKLEFRVQDSPEELTNPRKRSTAGTGTNGRGGIPGIGNGSGFEGTGGRKRGSKKGGSKKKAGAKRGKKKEKKNEKSGGHGMSLLSPEFYTSHPSRPELVSGTVTAAAAVLQHPSPILIHHHADNNNSRAASHIQIQEPLSLALPPPVSQPQSRKGSVSRSLINSGGGSLQQLHLAAQEAAIAAATNTALTPSTPLSAIPITSAATMPPTPATMPLPLREHHASRGLMPWGNSGSSKVPPKRRNTIGTSMVAAATIAAATGATTGGMTPGGTLMLPSSPLNWQGCLSDDDDQDHVAMAATQRRRMQQHGQSQSVRGQSGFSLLGSGGTTPLSPTLNAAVSATTANNNNTMPSPRVSFQHEQLSVSASNTPRVLQPVQVGSGGGNLGHLFNNAPPSSSLGSNRGAADGNVNANNNNSNPAAASRHSVNIVVHDSDHQQQQQQHSSLGPTSFSSLILPLSGIPIPVQGHQPPQPQHPPTTVSASGSVSTTGAGVASLSTSPPTGGTPTSVMINNNNLGGLNPPTSVGGGATNSPFNSIRSLHNQATTTTPRPSATGAGGFFSMIFGEPEEEIDHSGDKAVYGYETGGAWGHRRGSRDIDYDDDDDDDDDTDSESTDVDSSDDRHSREHHHHQQHHPVVVVPPGSSIRGPVSRGQSLEVGGSSGGLEGTVTGTGTGGSSIMFSMDTPNRSDQPQQRQQQSIPPSRQGSGLVVLESAEDIELDLHQIQRDEELQLEQSLRQRQISLSPPLHSHSSLPPPLGAGGATATTMFGIGGGGVKRNSTPHTPSSVLQFGSSSLSSSSSSSPPPPPVVAAMSPPTSTSLFGNFFRLGGGSGGAGSSAAGGSTNVGKDNSGSGFGNNGSDTVGGQPMVATGSSSGRQRSQQTNKEIKEEQDAAMLELQLQSQQHQQRIKMLKQQKKQKEKEKEEKDQQQK